MITELERPLNGYVKLDDMLDVMVDLVLDIAPNADVDIAEQIVYRAVDGMDIIDALPGETL